MAAAVVSCASPQQKVFDQAKVDVQAFLDKGGDDYDNAVVTEVIRVDSAYTPFMELNSLVLSLTDYYGDLTERCKEMSETGNDNLFVLKKLAAIDEFKKMDEFRAIQSSIIDSMKDPFAAEEKNRVCVYAKISIDGKPEVDSYFYYNAKQADIGHSSNGLFNRLEDVFDIGDRILKVQNNILDMD